MRDRLFWLSVAIGIVFCQRVSEASIRYQPLSELVRGGWTLNAPGDYTIHPDGYRLDVNQDGLVDLGFAHTYIPQTLSLSPTAVARLNTAQGGAAAIGQILHEARGFALEAASATIGQEPLLRRLDERFQRRMDAVDLLADTTAFQGQLLLNGDSGVDAITTDVDTQVLAMTEAARPGFYSVEVTTVGRRAAVDAAVRQEELLSEDEILTINGVNVPLEAGFDQIDVIHRINEFTNRTGVVADDYGMGAVTRIYTHAFGESEQASIISNRGASRNSSGFGTSERNATGGDIVVELSGTEYRGDGRILKLDYGPYAGTRLSFAAQEGSSAHTTVIGNQGRVIVTDSRLIMPLDASGQPTVDFALPSLETEALGIGVHNNSFDHLQDVFLSNATAGQDAVIVVEEAISEVDRLIASISDFLDVYAHPEGVGAVEAISDIRFAARGGEVRLLEEGELIGPGNQWSSERYLDASQLRDPGHDLTDFLGIEVTIRNQRHYGWIGLQIDEESGMLLRDMAIELLPGSSISAGTVPEPSAVSILGWGLILALGKLGSRTKS